MVEIALGKGYNAFRLTIGGNPDYMIRPTCSLALTISLALAVPVFAGRGADLKVEGLKCEYRVNPLGLDTHERYAEREAAEQRIFLRTEVGAIAVPTTPC